MLRECDAEEILLDGQFAVWDKTAMTLGFLM